MGKRRQHVVGTIRKALARPQPPHQDSRKEARERRGAANRRAIREQREEE